MSKISWRYFAILLLFLSLSAFSEIDLSKIHASLKLDKAKVKMGDKVELSIEVKAPKGLEIEIEEIGPKIQGLRIVDAGTNDPKVDDDEVLYKKWYQLETDLSGSYVLPETTVKVKSGEDVKEIKTSEIFLEVESSSPKDQKEGEVSELRDIKDLMKVDHGLPAWAKILIIIFILGSVGFGIYYFIKKRKVKVTSEIVIPPHEKALSRLEEIEKIALGTPESFKKYHFILSETFRTYVEGIYSFKATDMTLEEIKRNLSNVSAIRDDLKKEFLFVLEKADIVKFTDFPTTVDESRLLCSKTKEFILKTKPIEEKVEEVSI